jgi:hypothetical protein
MCIKNFHGTVNVKNERTNVSISFWNETKTFWYRFRICFIENRLFRFGLASALLDQIEMISFDKTNSGTNSNVLVSFRLDIKTFLERLFLYCFDITRMKTEAHFICLQTFTIKHRHSHAL